MNAFREKELKRIRRERKALEEYERAMRNGLSREGRQEVEELKARLAEAVEEAGRRDTKFQAAQARLRDRVATLEKERDELREQVHNLEALRATGSAKNIGKVRKRGGNDVAL